MTRALALLAALLFAVFPIRAALVDPGVSWRFKLAWLALFAAGLLRPAWRALVIVVLVPLVPWMPLELNGMPFGIVHFVVLSQALPWLLRPSNAAAGERGTVSVWWWLLVGVAAASLSVQYAAYGTLFVSAGPVFKELAANLGIYAFSRPGPAFENMVAATMVFATGALVFAIVRSSPGPRLDIAQALGGVAVAIALVGFWQAATGAGLRLEWRINDPFITRINATFGDPNALGAFLAAVLPVLLALAGGAAGRTRWLWLAATGAAAAALVMTAGRIAAIAAAVGFAVTLGAAIAGGFDRLDPMLFVRHYLRRAVIAFGALAVVGTLALVAAGTALDARHAEQRSYLDTWLYTFNLRNPLDVTAKGRLVIWKAAIRMIEDRPGFGIGIGRIYRLFGYYAEDTSALPDRMTFSAHNTFLNVGAELGLTGLAVWLLLLASAWRLGWRRVRRPADGDDGASRWLDAGLLGGLTACIVAMTTGDRAILYEDLVLLGTITGLLAAGRIASAPASGGQWRGLAIGLALVLVTLPPRIVAERRSVPLDHVTAGLNPVEFMRDGTRFRWSSGRSMFYLPSSASSLTLRLRSGAPFAQTARVFVRGTLVASVELSDHNWTDVRPVLPRNSQDPYQRIEVLVSPTWTPPGDGRELGVMLDWTAR